MTATYPDLIAKLSDALPLADTPDKRLYGQRSAPFAAIEGRPRSSKPGTDWRLRLSAAALFAMDFPDLVVLAYVPESFTLTIRPTTRYDRDSLAVSMRTHAVGSVSLSGLVQVLGFRPRIGVLPRFWLHGPGVWAAGPLTADDGEGKR